MRIIATLAAVLILTAPAEAQTRRQVAFAASNTLYTLFHEFAHAAIDQFALPVLGQEEDAADTFAAIQIIRWYDPQDAMAILLDVAEAGFIAHEAAEADGALAYYGEHDLDAQRAYRAICHLYGADPDQFEEAAIWADLPEERKESCEYDSALAVDSWDGLIGDLSPGPGAPDEIIRIWYHPHPLADLIKDLEVVEDVAAIMSETLDWPHVITLRVATCGEANAFYDPGPVEVLLCYELFEEFLEVAG